MEYQPYAPERLRSAPTASVSAVGTSLSGDESEGSGRHSSFGFQPRLPLPPGSRRTSSADTNAGAAPGSRFGYKKQHGHARSASTEPGWQPLGNEQRSDGNFGHQGGHGNTLNKRGSPTGVAVRNRARAGGSFGYQPRQLKRVEKGGMDATVGDDGNDGVVQRPKNFGYQPRQQVSTVDCGDVRSKNELIDEGKCADSGDRQRKENGTTSAVGNVCVDAPQQKHEDAGREERTNLLAEQHKPPVVVAVDAGLEKVISSQKTALPGLSSQQDGHASTGCHNLVEGTGANVDAEPTDTIMSSAADFLGLSSVDEDEDFVHFEYAAPHTEEVGLKHPCMAREPAPSPVAGGPSDDGQLMTGPSDVFSRSSGGFRSKTPESITAMQYANELLEEPAASQGAGGPPVDHQRMTGASDLFSRSSGGYRSRTPDSPGALLGAREVLSPQLRATPVACDDSSSDGELEIREKQFPFSYMTGFNPTWLDSESDTESERTRAYPPAASKNGSAVASEDERCPVIHVNESKGKYKAEEMDIDSSSDDYVLEETDVVLQNILSDQSAPRTPSVQEGCRAYLQASNMSARSALTGSPSTESQRDEASMLLQKLMTRSSMTSRSAEDDVNSPYDRRTAARLSLLSRSSGRSGGWDEPMGNAHEDGREGANEGPGMEAALQKLMVSVHRMNEEARDGTTAEKTVSSWLQEDRLDGGAARGHSEVGRGGIAKMVEGGRMVEDRPVDGVAGGAAEDRQTDCVGHPIVASELSYSCSEDDTVDDGRLRSPASSVGHTNWEAVDGSGALADASDEEVDGADCQQAVHERPCEGGQSQPGDLKSPSENAQTVASDGASPEVVEDEEDGCDVVMVTARDLCVASPSATSCNEGGNANASLCSAPVDAHPTASNTGASPCAPPSDVQPTASALCEICSENSNGVNGEGEIAPVLVGDVPSVQLPRRERGGNSEGEITPVLVGGVSSAQRGYRQEASETRRDIEPEGVRRTHRRTLDLALQLDKGWMVKPCLAVKTRSRSADFEASGMNPPRSPLRRRMDIVVRMDDQWHFGGRLTKRKNRTATQPRGYWAQPMLNALYAPIHGISQALGLGKNR